MKLKKNLKYILQYILLLSLYHKLRVVSNNAILNDPLYDGVNYKHIVKAKKRTI